MKKHNKILVSRPTLPNLEEFVESLKEIWDSKWITNNGKFHQEFEKELAEYLGVKYVSLFTNGTLALISALQVLRITGEVITTPYSFVATTHALHWIMTKNQAHKNTGILLDGIENLWLGLLKLLHELC